MGAPRTWTLRGSTVGINFDVIDTRSNITWSNSTPERTFTLSTRVAYRYYRVNITANNGHEFLSIGYIHFGDIGGKALLKNATTNKVHTVMDNQLVEADGESFDSFASGINVGSSIMEPYFYWFVAITDKYCITNS